MKKVYLLLLCFFYSAVFSQDILMSYPEGQESYKGGNVQFYKDFNQILKEKNLKPCEDKNEMYSFGVLIKPDNTISFVADDETYEDQYNKCAKDLSREVAKYLKGWNAAKKDAKNVSAVARFLIIPDQLFGTLKDGFDLDKDRNEVLPEFPGGIPAFRKKAASNVDVNRFDFTNDFTIAITFIVERDGRIENVQLDQSSGLQEFDEMMLRAVFAIKKKWKPATINGIPVRYRFRIPFKFQASGF